MKSKQDERKMYGTKVYSFKNNTLYNWKQCRLKRDEEHTLEMMID
jgi:hypothetical protein